MRLGNRFHEQQFHSSFRPVFVYLFSELSVFANSLQVLLELCSEGDYVPI